MKKIISLGAAAAVLSLTAVAASAVVAPTFTPASPVAGDTVTVEVVAYGMTQSATTFTVNVSDNLTMTGEAVPVGGGLFNPANNMFTWAGATVPADGTVLLTLTYTVDAASDEEVSVSLTPDAASPDVSVDAVTVVVVDGESTDVPDTTTTEEEAPTSEEVGYTTEEVELPTTEEDSGLTTTTEETTTEPTADSGNTDSGDSGNTGAGDKGNPGTGVALAVVPAVLAGAAIVVAKKRK